MTDQRPDADRPITDRPSEDRPTPDRPRAVLEHWPIRIRQLEIVRRTHVTPRMVRVTLGGPGHEGFESHIADEHVKLLFPDPASDTSKIPTQQGDRLSWPKPLVPSRDYTVRRYDSSAGEVDIDVVVHDGGLASTRLQHAPIGERVWVAGPPRGVRIPDAFTWQAYVGDETALPAIARRLEELPRTTRGVALIEIADDAERQAIDAPAGVDVRWLSREGAPAGTTSLLVDAARATAIPSGGGAYVWFGGEQSAVKPMRAWVKAAGLGPGEFDITGYWRKGVTGNHLDGNQILHAVKHLLHLPH